MRIVTALFFIALISCSCSLKKESGEMNIPGSTPKTPEIKASEAVLTSTTSVSPEPLESKTQATEPTPQPTPASSRIAPCRFVPSKRTITNSTDGSEMLLIPAGEFIMGSLENYASTDEMPQHKVYIDAYYISKYEVTNEQFRKFINSTKYKAEGPWQRSAQAGKEKHPVGFVTWNDASAYCRWAGGGLPTEAQWEKAARGTDGRLYPWGNKWVDLMFSTVYCTKPVGSSSIDVSPYGVCDLGGNVSEWCSDWYNERYYELSSSRNPKGPDSGEKRVERGGDFMNDGPSLTLCANRHESYPNAKFSNKGLRLCYQ